MNRPATMPGAGRSGPPSTGNTFPGIGACGASSAPAPDAVRLVFAEGFPTLLPRSPILARLLREHGAPFRIRRLASGRILFEWAPLFPGTTPPECSIADPWRHLSDRRAIVGAVLAVPGPEGPQARAVPTGPSLDSGSSQNETCLDSGRSGPAGAGPVPILGGIVGGTVGGDSERGLETGTRNENAKPFSLTAPEAGASFHTMNDSTVRVRLYFGTEVPPHNQDRYQKRALGAFDRSHLLAVVAREFPAGFTVYNATGQWSGPDGRTIAEDTLVVEVLGDDTIVDRARYLARWHKQANGQDSVLLTVETLSSVEFL